MDVGYAFGSGNGFPTDIVNRGKWIDVNQDSNTGAITPSGCHGIWIPIST